MAFSRDVINLNEDVVVKAPIDGLNVDACVAGGNKRRGVVGLVVGVIISLRKAWGSPPYKGR